MRSQHCFFPIFPLSFSPLGPLPISLACVLLPPSRLSLKISGGGPLIASLISHVRQLHGCSGDVELLQIITRLSPFHSTAPSIPPSSFHCVCSPIYPSHSLSHDLMINYGWEFENKSFFANQNEISPLILVITVWRWCCWCLFVAKACPAHCSVVLQAGWNE